MFEAVAEIAAALEHSGLGQVSRGSTWLYPLANLLHVLGAALLVGAIATFDILVLRRADHAALVGRTAIPLAAFGLALQIPTGLVLLAAEATALVRNPAFLLKMGMIVLGIVNLAVFHWRFGAKLRYEMPLEGAEILAAISLAVWILVLLAGRAIAYI